MLDKASRGRPDIHIQRLADPSELLFAQSGGIFEATRFFVHCEVSRTTIINYLALLEATFVVHVIRPCSGRRSTEIIAAPRLNRMNGQMDAWAELKRSWNAAQICALTTSVAAQAVGMAPLAAGIGSSMRPRCAS